ncbi:hypothetical protein NLI96_g7544 [Meripilus lineatus]|uniref:Uncharacterized protein n=1 Tax=Meripilus lineatus TaxID=2056292 RepID=A0AAD5V155_9APHY|nr:hypothetical protein NLI96_g7544 [Physisporinus lineatus]
MDECNDINSCRTRIGIATSCISTISLCTWAVFHPNIPGPKEPTWKVIGRRIGWMIGGVLAPEIYLFISFRQFIGASEFEKYRELGWTRTHGYFALMGGFMIYDGQTADKIGFYDPTPLTRPFIKNFIHDFLSLEAFERSLSTRDSESRNRSSPTQPLGQLVHSLAALKTIQSDPATFEGILQQVYQDHGISIGQCINQVEWYNQHLSDHAIHLLYEGREEERLFLKGILAFLTAYVHPTSLRENENTDRALPIENAEGLELATGNSRLAPRISIEDIRDKSKNDGFAKFIVVLQVVWFILQYAARAWEKLLVTEIEIFTSAFCGIAVVANLLWRNKPFTVGRGYAIRWRDDGWEVFIPPAPPFVEAPQVSWIHRCRKAIAGIMGSIKKVLTTYGPLRGGDSVYQMVSEPTEGPPSHLPCSSVETTYPPSYRSSQPSVGFWQKLKFTLSKLGKGVEIMREVVFQQIPFGQTTLRDSGKRPAQPSQV